VLWAGCCCARDGPSCRRKTTSTMPTRMISLPGGEAAAHKRQRLAYRLPALTGGTVSFGRSRSKAFVGCGPRLPWSANRPDGARYSRRQRPARPHRRHSSHNMTGRGNSSRRREPRRIGRALAAQGVKPWVPEVICCLRNTRLVPHSLLRTALRASFAAYDCLSASFGVSHIKPPTSATRSNYSMNTADHSTARLINRSLRHQLSSDEI
jgi:hypothetical protein